MGILGGSLSQLGGGFAGVGNIIAGFAGAGVLGAATAGIGEATKALQWSVGQAVESETVWNRLRFAVEKQGGSWAQAETGVKAFAAQLQTTTRYSDEQTAVALARLMGYGMDLDTAMRTVGSAMDLATAKQIDLETASDLLGKAFAGNTSMLGRYGIIVKDTETVSRSYKDMLGDLTTGIAQGTVSTGSLASMMSALGLNVYDTSGKMMSASDMMSTLRSAFADGQVDMTLFTGAMGAMGIATTETKDKAATFQSVMDQVNTRYGAAAQADATTYAGTMDKMKNAMSDLGEKVGAALLPSLTSMTTSLSEMMTYIGPLIDQIIKDVGPALKDCGAAFTELSDAIGGSGNIIKDIIMAVGGFLKVEIIGWSKIFEFVAKSITGWVRLFEGVSAALAPVAAAFGAFVGQVSSTISSVIGIVSSGISAVISAFSSLVGAVSGIWSSIMGVVSSVVGGIVSAVSGGFSAAYSIVSGIFGGIYSTITSILSGIVSYIRGIIDSIISAFQSLWRAVTGGSIWPEMMAQMEKQTKSGMEEVSKAFEGGLEVGVMRPAAAAAPPPVAPAVVAQREITVNFSIQGVTDPDAVAREVENRIVEVLSRRSEVTAA